MSRAVAVMHRPLLLRNSIHIEVLVVLRWVVAVLLVHAASVGEQVLQSSKLLKLASKGGRCGWLVSGRGAAQASNMYRARARSPWGSHRRWRSSEAFPRQSSIGKA